MFEQKIIEFLKRNPNFEKYKALYEHYVKSPEDFKSPIITFQTFLDDHVLGLLYSTIERDKASLEREGKLLIWEMEQQGLIN